MGSIRLHWDAGNYAPCHGGDLPCAGLAWWNGKTHTCDRCGAQFELTPTGNAVVDEANRMSLRVRGWILDVPICFPQKAIDRLVQFKLIPMQEDKLRSLPPGSRRDELTVALEILRREGVSQNVVGARGDGKGDIVGFQSTKRTSSKLYTDLGKARNT